MSRPPKRRRTPSELKQLAIQLHLGWVPGDSIIGHLRKLTPTIQNMLWHDGIHVEDIAAALNLAGIKYRTGTEWTRTTLQNKLTHARNTLHQKSTQENKFSTRANTNKKLRSASTAANVKPLSPQPPAPDAPTQPKELRSTVSHPTDPRSPIAAAASSFVAPPNLTKSHSTRAWAMRRAPRGAGTGLDDPTLSLTADSFVESMGLHRFGRPGR